MNAMLDSQRIEFACPNCQGKLSETIGKLKANPTLVCGGCGQSVAVDAANFNAGVAQVSQALEKLTRTLGRLGK